MTNSKEMLNASPTGVTLGVSEVATAIDACLNCVQACTSCADSDLVEEDVDTLRTCIALDQNCAEVCDVTAGVLSRVAHWDEFVVQCLLQACVRICTTCARECSQHAAHHRHCAVCETVCLECVEACSALLDAEALAGIQRLGGV
jgi:hypothetical protein